MQVICVKLIYPNTLGSIEGIRRKTVSISQHDQVVTVSSHFAVSNVLSKDVTLPKEMGGFMTYKTPAASHSRLQSILLREIDWPSWKLLDQTRQKIWDWWIREALYAH